MTTLHPTLLALEALDLSTVTPCLLDRLAPRKAQAVAARALFKRLGLKEISVKVPTYSMASSVNIRLPKAEFTPEQWEAFEIARNNGTEDLTEVRQVNARRWAIVQKLQAVLDLAFPLHRDRSDHDSDYFDYRWIVE